MTLYFPNDLVKGALNDVFIDGDVRGITNLHPGGWNTYRLQLTSRYTNRDIDADETQFEWVLPLSPLNANERYTHFVIDGLSTDLSIQNQFKSGYYDYTLWATYLEIDFETMPFDASQWNQIQEGEAKVKTKTTNDMQRGREDEVVKYTTDPNTAQSYVIYNP